MLANIGLGELIIIATVAIVFVRPNDIPEIIKRLRLLLQEGRKAVSEVRKDLEDLHQDVDVEKYFNDSKQDNKQP